MRSDYKVNSFQLSPSVGSASSESEQDVLKIMSNWSESCRICKTNNNSGENLINNVHQKSYTVMPLVKKHFGSANPVVNNDLSGQNSTTLLNSQLSFKVFDDKTSARAPDEATALLYVTLVCIYCWWPGLQS